MRTNSLIPLTAVVFIIANCGVAIAAKNEQQPTNTPSAAKNADPAQGDDIVGEWEMVGSVVDTNDNLQIDEAERNNLKPTMKDRMKLNSDGSGAFTVAELPGRYELKESGSSSGKKTLTWFDKANGRHRIGTIVKITKSELHIKEPGGHGLFVWKRQ